MFLLFLLGTSISFMLFSMLAAFLIRKSVVVYDYYQLGKYRKDFVQKYDHVCPICDKGAN